MKRQRLRGQVGRAKQSGDKKILITQSQAVLSSIGYQMVPFFYEVQNGPALSLEDSTGAQALALQSTWTRYPEIYTIYLSSAISES